jgi:hypothetical protein
MEAPGIGSQVWGEIWVMEAPGTFQKKNPKCELDENGDAWYFFK